MVVTVVSAIYIRVFFLRSLYHTKKIQQMASIVAPGIFVHLLALCALHPDSCNSDKSYTFVLQLHTLAAVLVHLPS